MEAQSPMPGSSAGTPSVADAKKALAKAKLDFDLHVSLIMRTDEVSKSKALFMAWLEGPKGLETRLTKK